jgi:PAS domain S-box-containing protein
MSTRFLHQLAAPNREHFLETLLESVTNYAIITLDAHGIITGWDGGAKPIFGWGGAEVLGHHTDLFFTLEDRAAEIPSQEMASARRTGKAAGERWHIRKDGSRFWSNGSLMPLMDGTGYLKILRDRTEQRVRDAVTQANEAFLRSVLESSGDCIKLLTLDGRLEFMSAGGQRVMEVDDFCSIQGSYWPNFWEGKGRAAAEAALALAHKGGVGHFLGFARTAKGSPRWWDVQVTRIPASDDTTGKFLSISRDITQDRERQLAIDEHNARLKLLSDTASQLIGGSDPNIALEALFQAAPGHLDLDVCLHLSPDAVGTLRLQSCVGLTPDEAARLARLDPGETICGWVAQTRQPLYLADVQTSNNAHAQEVQGLGLQAYACHPLIANGELLGTLSFGSRKRATFSPEDLAFFRTISTYVAVIKERQRAEAELKETEARLRLAVEAAAIGIFDHDLTSGILSWDARTKELFGLPPEAGVSYEGTFLAGLHPEDRAAADQALQDAIDVTGPGIFDVELRTINPLDGGTRWIAVRGRAVREVGRTIRFIGTVRDITGRKRAEQQLRLLHRELGHRLKNVLTMVQAITTQTLRNARSIEEARDTLAARLVTMGRAQDVLIAGTTDGADILTVLNSALEPHSEPQMDRFRLRGPKIQLNPSAALSLALLVHELATNALKYGALSAPQGKVDLIWTLTIDDQEPCLKLSWSEHGGPPVVAPSRKGFGTRLITRGLAGDVGGKVQLDYDLTGVVCTLTAPLAELTESRDSRLRQ